MRIGVVGLATGSLALFAGACSLVASLGDDYTTADGGESPDGSTRAGHEAGAESGASDGGGEGGGSVDGGADADAQGSTCTTVIDPTFANGVVPSLDFMDAGADFTHLAELSDHELVAALHQNAIVKNGAFLASFAADGGGAQVTSSGYDFVVGLVAQGTTGTALLTANSMPDTLLTVEPMGGATGPLASVPMALNGSSLALAADAYLVGIQQGASFGVAAYLFDGGADPMFGDNGAVLATCPSTPTLPPLVVAIDGGRLAATTCVDTTDVLELVAFGNTESQGDAGPAVRGSSIFPEVELFAGRPGGSVAYLVSSDTFHAAVTALSAQGKPVFDGGTLPITTLAVPTAATVDSQDRLIFAARTAPQNDAGAFQLMRMTSDGTIDPSWQPTYSVPGSMTVTPQAVIVTSDDRVVVGFSVAYPNGHDMNDLPGVVAFCP